MIGAYIKHKYLFIDGTSYFIYKNVLATNLYF